MNGYTSTVREYGFTGKNAEAYETTTMKNITMGMYHFSLVLLAKRYIKYIESSMRLIGYLRKVN